MYIHVCTYMYMYVHVCTCMYMYVHVCILQDDKKAIEKHI